MINIRFIINLLGKLMLIESACFLLCVLISLLYRENDTPRFSVFHINYRRNRSN